VSPDVTAHDMHVDVASGIDNCERQRTMPGEIIPAVNYSRDNGKHTLERLTSRGGGRRKQPNLHRHKSHPGVIGYWRECRDESSVDHSLAFKSRAVAPTSDAFSIDNNLYFCATAALAQVQLALHEPEREEQGPVDVRGSSR
jgi:hypothetical protein